MLDRTKLNLSQTGVYLKSETHTPYKGPFGVQDLPSREESGENVRVRKCPELGVTLTSKVLDSSGTITEVPISLCWNPSRILYGFNGWLIVTNKELALAHAKLHTLLLRAFGKEVADKLVPGFSSECRTFLQSTEIPVQLKDDGRQLLRCISQISHPAIRKKGYYTQGQSMKLPGTKVSFQIYDKSLESGCPCEDESEKVVRYEVLLWREKFAKYLPEKIREDEKVLTLDVDSRYEAFRNFTKDIRGYFSARRSFVRSKPAAFIVDLHQYYKLPIEGLLELYEASSRNNEETMRGVARKVRLHLEHCFHRESFEELFPAAPPPAVNLAGKKAVEGLLAVRKQVVLWDLPTTPAPDLVEFFSSVRTFS